MPQTEETAIKLLQERAVLPSKRLCKKGHEMRLYIGKEVQWMCNKKECRSKPTYYF